MTSSFEVRIHQLSLNILGEYSQATIILGKICKQAIIKVPLIYSYWKMFFIGQNSKHVHMPCFFLTFYLLLINLCKYLIGVYFSLHQRNTLYKYKLRRKVMVKKIQIDMHFHLSKILILRNPVVFFCCFLFFSSRVKIPYQQLLIFFGFMDTFLKSN